MSRFVRHTWLESTLCACYDVTFGTFYEWEDGVAFPCFPQDVVTVGCTIMNYELMKCVCFCSVSPSPKITSTRWTESTHRTRTNRTDFMASVQELVHSSVSQLLARKTFLGKYVCKYRRRTVARSWFETFHKQAPNHSDQSNPAQRQTQQKWIFFVLVRRRSSPWHAGQTLNAIMASYWWLSGAIPLITVHSVLFDRFVSDFYSHRSLLWWYFRGFSHPVSLSMLLLWRGDRGGKVQPELVVVVVFFADERLIPLAL